jgi:phosphatidylglycerol:prolipoprotein diacylglycerol transferase
MMFGIYLIFTGVERFFIELIRVNTRYVVAGISFTQAEMISLFLVLAGITMIVYVQGKARKQHVTNG